MKRLFLEISSGLGPAECELLVAKLMERLTSELRRKVHFREVALNGDREKSLVKSVLFELEGGDTAAPVPPGSVWKHGWRTGSWNAAIRPRCSGRGMSCSLCGDSGAGQGASFCRNGARSTP